MSELLSTDIVAVLGVGDYVFVGIGYSLCVYQKSTDKIVSKLDVFYPDKIHGIIKGPENYLAVFGGKNLSIVEVNSFNRTVVTKLHTDIHRFNDWIIAVDWWNNENNVSKLAILSAHNSLCLYNWKSERIVEYQCEEKCILYGGSVVNDGGSNFVILAGTVFQEIVIWATSSLANKTEAPVLHRLKGHNGVIFSVTFDPVQCLICSTSDDRTIRLWSVQMDPLATHNAKWENATISLTTTMFGHTARVWRALIRKDFVISIGEDSLLCIWTIKGTLINKIEAHHGAPIWSVDVSENGDIIITGGGDGAVHVWPLGENTNLEIKHIPMESFNEVPKHIGFLSNGSIITVTQTGKLITYNTELNFERSVDTKICSNYIVMQISPNRKFIGLARLDGCITIYGGYDKTGYLEKVLEQRIMDSKILSIHWLSDDLLLLCGMEGCLKILKIVNGIALIESQHILPHSRERWTTAATVHKNILICGDRAGSIHVFRTSYIEIDTNFSHPIQSLLKIHGRLGVHSCMIFENKLLSTGRDGTLRFYELLDDGPKIINVLQINRMPMDWVSTTLKTHSELYVFGFKEVDFVVYSTMHQRVLLRIHCGGGHRSWDCVLKDGNFNFAYIRDKQINFVKSQLHSLAIPALQNGFHAKEVYCIQRIPTCTDHNILISGGEDRNLLITHVIKSQMSNSNIQQFSNIALLSGHISSIRTLAIINLTATAQCSENLVFSGGGRAQLKVWLISIKFVQNTLDNNNSRYLELASHMLRGTDQQQRRFLQQEIQQSHYMDPETRYMHMSAYRVPTNSNLVLLLVACSDGFFRIFSYNIITRNISLQTAVSYNNQCILKTHLFDYNKNKIALTMATDGIVNFWCVNEMVDIMEHLPNKDKLVTTPLSPFARLKLHQCGINSYDLNMLKGSKFILATGGDDNLLCLLIFKIKLEKGTLSINEVANWTSISNHSTQITGLLLDERGSLISVGKDQKVLTFNYLYNQGNLTVTLLNEIMTSVADVQGMTTCFVKESDNILLCIYGKGFEVMKRKLQLVAAK